MHRPPPLLLALLVACSRYSPLAAQSPVSATPGVPSLDSLDLTTRQSIQLACSTEMTQGPVAYGRCLNKQLDALRRAPGIPSLDGLDMTTRQSIQLACSTEMTQGPVAYGKCLRSQLLSIGIQR